MKKLLTIITFTIFLITACEQQDTIVQPVDKDEVTAISKLNWIPLPQPSGIVMQKRFKTFDFIEWNKGGVLHIKEEYEKANGEKVKIDIKAKFEKEAWDESCLYDDVKYIYSEEKENAILFTMEVIDESTLTIFDPHIQFNVPVKLDIKYEGLDLSALKDLNEDGKIDENDIDFVYFSDSGEPLEWFDPEKIKVDVEKGKIEFKESEIPHFSRFGFLN